MLTSKQKTGIVALAFSALGLIGLVAQEGYTDRAIIPTKGDVPTVGFGSTTGVKMGDTTTPVRALQRVGIEVRDVYEAAVKRCAPVPMSQGEYDVYVDLTYNIGAGAFCKSTMAKRLNAQDYIGACEAIKLYRFAAGYDCSTPGNKRCAGLWQRRLESYNQCMAAQ